MLRTLLTVWVAVKGGLCPCVWVIDCEAKPPYWPVVEVPTKLPAPVEKKLTPSLGHGGAVDLGELHFQQDFLRAHGAEGEHVDNILRIRGSQFSGALGDVLGSNVAGENNGGARGRDGDLFLGEDAMFFFGAGADIDVDAEIEAARAFVFVPDDQRDFAGGASVNQDLGGSQYGRIGDAWGRSPRCA